MTTVLTHLLTHSLTHLLTHSLTYSLTHSLTHSGWYENDIRRRSLTSLLNPKPEKGEKEFKYYGPPIATSTSATPRSVDVPNGYYCGGPNAQELWLGLDAVKTALNIPLDAVFFQSDNGGSDALTHSLTHSLMLTHSLTYSLMLTHSCLLTQSALRTTTPRPI